VKRFELRVGAGAARPRNAASSGARWPFAISLALALSSRAEPLTLDQARRRAERAAPEVALSAVKVDAAKQDVSLAQTWANPSLTVGTALRTARLSTGLGLPLLLFGQRGKEVDAARAEVETFVRDTLVARSDAVWAATQAWVDLWEAESRARLLASAAVDAARLEAIAAAKQDAGAGSRLDLLRTTAEARRASSEAAQAGQYARAAGARLAPAMGATGLVWSTEGEPGFSTDLPPLEVLQQRLGGHPVAQRNLAATSAAASRVDLELRRRWPELNAQVTLNQFDPTLEGPDVLFGLTFELPVLNLRGAAIEKARLQRSSAELSQTLDEQRLRSALADGWERSQASLRHLRVLHDEVLPALEEARTLTDEAFRLGTVDLLRVLDAAARSWRAACPS
jgi:outer membrane protein TolC